jgi:O-antigen/teichoic acid export membrane protein
MSAQRRSTNVFQGVAWLGIASGLVGVLDAIATFILLNKWHGHQLISTEQYGIATKCAWLFPILDQMSEAGLSAALIQRDDHSETRVSTVFWINAMLATALTLLLVAFAPIAATRFFGHAVVGSMLITFGAAKLMLGTGFFVPMAMLRRQERFKEISIIKVIANTGEFFAKVGFAIAGFGVWCFVLGPVVRTFIYVVGCQARFPYRPRWMFNLREARDYLTFGLRASGSQILFYFYTNVDYPIVGAFFGDRALGLYRLAYELVLDPVRIISNVVVDAAFPTFAKLRTNADAVMKRFIQFTRLNLITVMSFSAVVLVATPELIGLLFPNMQGAVPAARILSMVGVLRAVSFVAPPLLDGMGRPDRTLTYQTVAAVALPTAYIVAAATLGRTIGFESVAVAWAVGYPIAFCVLIYMAAHILGWTAMRYAREVAGVAGCMVLAGLAAAGARYLVLDAPMVVRLAVTIATLVLVAGVLLAYTQNMSLRTAMKSLKAPPGDHPT